MIGARQNEGGEIDAGLRVPPPARVPILSGSIFRHPATHLETTRLLLPLTLGGAEIRLALMGQIFRYPGGGVRPPVAQPLDADSLEILNQIPLDVAPCRGEGPAGITVE